MNSPFFFFLRYDEFIVCAFLSSRFTVLENLFSSERTSFTPIFNIQDTTQNPTKEEKKEVFPQKMSSSELWSKALLLCSAITLVIVSAFTLDMTRRFWRADHHPSSFSALPSGRDEIKPFILQGLLGIGLCLICITASFFKHRVLVRGVFAAVIVVEVYVVYTNRLAMNTGFDKCHGHYKGDASGEELCLRTVHSLFASTTLARVWFLALLLSTACKTDEALTDEGHDLEKSALLSFVAEHGVPCLSRNQDNLDPHACIAVAPPEEHEVLNSEEGLVARFVTPVELPN